MEYTEMEDAEMKAWNLEQLDGACRSCIQAQREVESARAALSGAQAVYQSVYKELVSPLQRAVGPLESALEEARTELEGAREVLQIHATDPKDWKGTRQEVDQVLSKYGFSYDEVLYWGLTEE